MAQFSGLVTAARVFRDVLRVPDPRTRALVPMVLHAEQARAIGVWDERGPDGLPVYDELALLWLKKAGKSATAAGFVLTELVGGLESDREIIIVASDFAQSKDVTFATTVRFIRRHPWLAKHLKVGTAEILYRETVTEPVTGGRHVEDHIIRAVPARDAKSLHGGNATLTVVDELWAVAYDALEALARSPARRAPRILYASYAGLRSQQQAGVPIWDLWKRWKAGDDPRLFVSYIGGPDGWKQIPWITQRLIDGERRRFAAVPSKFTRLYENTWATGDEGAFLSSDEIAAATDRDLVEPETPERGAVYSIGVDLGLTHDLTGVVLSHVDRNGRLTVDIARCWRGTRQKPVDLADVEVTVLELARRFNADVHLDQWQGAFMSQRLSQRGISVQVHTVESSRLDSYASLLKTLFVARQIRVPAVPELIEQLETIEGEELSRRDRVRFTSGPGGHDDLVMALCLSTETFVEWRVKAGQLRMYTNAIGRPALAEILGCHAAMRMNRYWLDCPIDDGTSAHPGCCDCAMWQSAIAAQEKHLADGGEYVPLRGFVSEHMHPNRWLTERRVERVVSSI